MTPNFDVTAHGLRYVHPSGCITDRPYGLGEILLLRFHTPMELLAERGLVNTGPGHCILYSANHPQWYRGSPNLAR